MTSIAISLKEFLASPEKYDELNLSSQNIDDEQCKRLAKILQDIDNIRIINLSNNAITDIGAQALADMLASNISIATLDLSKNYISDICIVDFNNRFSEWKVMILYSQQEPPLSEETIKFNQLLDRITERFDSKAYEELGSMFLQADDIYRAFKCYKAIKSNDKIDICYEALLSQKPMNLTFLEEIGDYWRSVESQEKAALIYNKIAQTRPGQFQDPIWNKVFSTTNDKNLAYFKPVQLQGEAFVASLLKDYDM